jgi:hypothetical protein
MNIYFILYVLGSIIVISGTFYYNSKTGHRLTAFVMPILFLAIAVFFGLRWFTPSGDSAINTNLSPVWPPANSINVCPDFLSLRSDVSGPTTTYYCVDPLGVTTNASGLQVWSSSAEAATQFQLGTTTAATTVGTTTTVASNTPIDVNTLCKNCNRMGLTWEGVCIPRTDSVQLAPGTTLPRPQ